MNSKTNILVKQALFLTLFFISANLVPPVNILGVPITFQTVVIFLIPYIFTLRQSLFWYLSLLLLTLVGIPMMAGFKSGLVVLFGPTAGFIYGWLIIIITINLCLRYLYNSRLKYLVMILASAVGLAIGGVGLSFYNELSIWNNIMICLASFLPIELVKLFIVHKIIAKLPSKYLNKEISNGS